MLIERISIAIGSRSFRLGFRLLLSLLLLDCARFSSAETCLVFRVTCQRVANILAHSFPTSFRGIRDPDVLVPGLEFVTGFLEYFNGIFLLTIFKTPKCLLQVVRNFAVKFELKPIPSKRQRMSLPDLIFFTSEATDCEAPRTSSFSELISDL